MSSRKMIIWFLVVVSMLAIIGTELFLLFDSISRNVEVVPLADSTSARPIGRASFVKSESLECRCVNDGSELR